MKTIQCIFCGHKREKAKEHILPRWLQFEVGGSASGHFKGTHIHMANPYPIDERKQSGESLVFGQVCKVCNGGWMSQLENGCKPVIQALINRNQKIHLLNKTDRHTIALWSFKTALMINAGSNYQKIIPNDHYKHIYSQRNLVKNLKVDLAYIDAKEEILWRQSNFEFGLAKSSEQNEFHELMQASYKITIKINSLGIRVSFFPNAKQEHYQFNYMDVSKTIRIWSYSKNPRFNPRSYFEDIDQFHYDISIVPNK